MPLLDIQFIGPVIAGFFSLAIGVFTFSQERKNATHRYFLVVTIVIAAWSFTIGVFHLSGDTSTSLWWNLHWLAGLFLAPTVFLTLKNFPVRELRMNLFVRFAAWAGGLAMAGFVVLLPEKFIQYYVVTPQSIPQVVVGPFAWLYELYFGVYFALGFLFLIGELWKAAGRKHAQIFAGFLGLFLGIGGASFTNLVLPIHFGVELIWLGPIFAVIGTTSFSYMLFGVQGGTARLLPISVLGITIGCILVLQMMAASGADSIILNGVILAGIIVLVIFLIRDTLLEAADVRRFQDLSQRLQRFNEDLKRADRVKTEFLAIVSHHLRTPLTHIKWALSELTKGSYGSLSSRQSVLMQELLANNDRLVAFIDSLMDTSRIEAGRINLKKEKIEIQQVIESVVKSFQDRAKNYYRVRMEMLPPASPVPVTVGDRELLGKVFENLIENALIYNKPGGNISIQTESEKGSIKIKIADTGIGIPSGDLKKIGEKFFRSEKAKAEVAEGTGLGIFIARHIVRLHGGNFEIESREGKGTTVTITLPFTIDEN